MVVDIIFGFLGAGKTTFIRYALAQLGSDTKTVVLVNEFGEVGIDGELLSAQGGNVVEMPSGCICCTLQTDFRSQLLSIIEEFSPDRIIIEPTGVATIRQIQGIVGAQLFEDRIDEIRSVMIADAASFMELYKANRHFVESQVENAHLVLLNKCDRVEKKKARVIQSAISAINPEINILMTSYGKVDWAVYQQALSEASHRRTADFCGILPALHDHEDQLGYSAFGRVYNTAVFNGEALRNLFSELNGPESDLGNIVRAKGMFYTGGGWLLMELAAGEVSTQPVRPMAGSRVSIIGKDLDGGLLDAALDRCRA